MTVDTTKVLPWQADTPSLLSQTLSHVARAWLVVPDGEGTDVQIALDLVSGSLSYDERRAPRVEARLTCRMSTVEEVLVQIDPRTGARLCIEVGYARPDGAVEAYQIVDLGLRSRYVIRPRDELLLNGASDEALAIDASPSKSGTVTASNHFLAIEDILDRFIAPGVTLNDGVVGSKGTSISGEPIEDKWEQMADFADAIDCKVYDDGMRNWWVSSQASLSTPALDLHVGEGGTVMDSEAGIDREAGWYNRVLVKYEWYDNSGTRHAITGDRKVTSGIYEAVNGNTRTLELRREVPTTQTRANNAAAALVRRTVTRGRTFTVRSISAYWLRPGQTVNVLLPLGDEEEHLVVAVDFDLREGTMQVVTRLPDNTGTIGA